MLVLRFAEAWIVEFYADGTVAAYNGYASGGTKEDAYYVIPSHIIKNLISYIDTNGIPHELVDGAISTSTFHK